MRLAKAVADGPDKYPIEPVLRDCLGVPGQRDVVWNGFAVLGSPHAKQVRFDPAAGLVVRHQQQTGKVQFLLGVDRETAPFAVFLVRAGVLPAPRLTSSSDEVPRHPLQVRNTASIFPSVLLFIAVCCRSRSKNVSGRFPRGPGGIAVLSCPYETLLFMTCGLPKSVRACQFQSEPWNAHHVRSIACTESDRMRSECKRNQPGRCSHVGYRIQHSVGWAKQTASVRPDSFAETACAGSFSLSRALHPGSCSIGDTAVRWDTAVSQMQESALMEAVT